MQTITLDKTIKTITGDNGAVILAKQGDVGRKICLNILDRGEPYPIPEEGQLSVWYAGTGGQGHYTSIGEESAFEVAENTVTVELPVQMLANDGCGAFCLVINNSDGGQMGLWNLTYYVEPVPGLDSAPVEDYYTMFSKLGQYIAQIENALPRTGGAMSGAIAMGGNSITGLADPKAETDAANRRFVETSVAAETAARMQQIAVERARIDAITQLPEGSTAGDAELEDIRVAYDGRSYSGAGVSVREQTAFLAGEMKAKHSMYRSRDLLLPGTVWENKAVVTNASADGGYTLKDASARLLGEFVALDHYRMVRYVVRCAESLQLFLNFFDEQKTLLSQSNYAQNGGYLTIPYNAFYVRFQVMWTDNSSIAACDAIDSICLIRDGAEPLDEVLELTEYEALLLRYRRMYNKLPRRPKDWVQGALMSNGKGSYTETRIHTRPIPFDYHAIKLKFGSGEYKLCFCAYDKDFALLRESGWLEKDTLLYLSHETAYVDFCVARADDGVITPGGIEAVDIRVVDVSGAHSADMRVMNFNVGHYGYGVANCMDDSLLAEKLPNYQKLLMEQACDLVAIEEEYAYLDKSRTKTSAQLYGPLFPYAYYPTSGWSAFHAKTGLGNTAEHTFAASDRPYISADITFNGKDIHVVCVHMHPSDQQVRGREMEELARYLADKDRFLVFGDFNVASVEEYDTLTSRGYKLANGGYLDFLNTYGLYTGYYENIVMSEDILVKEIAVPNTYELLTSDHLPVICTLTIVG